MFYKHLIEQKTLPIVEVSLLLQQITKALLYKMNKKILIPLVVVIVLLLAGVGVLYFNLHKQRKENADMEQLAALDKKEMENEYQQFADQ